MARAVALLSGGLDSTLAVKLMVEQGIEVSALNFVSPFCTCTKKGCRHQATEVAEQLGVPLTTIPVGEEYIRIIRNPNYGYGKNMNPCLDCRMYMFGRAREHMEAIGASFVVTGEVLGERPMSQRRDAMALIEDRSGLRGRILRPLCAHLFEPTLAELEGIVDRSKLLAIRGRSRKPQMALAAEKGITEYPCPAGGCRLTDPHFARRLRDAFAHEEDSLSEIALLKYGRHFRLETGAKVVVGRNEQENGVLMRLHLPVELLVLEALDHPGPITLLLKSSQASDIETAAGLCLTYSDCEPGGARVRVGDDAEILARPVGLDAAKRWLLQ